MPQLTFVTVCMGRLAFLRQTLGRMAGQAESQCILVDYSCPARAGDWAEKTHPAVRVLRLPGHVTFSITAARNAGARLVQTPWICFVDCDVALDAAFAATLLPGLQPGHFYRPRPQRTGTIGTWLVGAADFHRAGGFDEALRCYGEDDYDAFD